VKTAGTDGMMETICGIMPYPPPEIVQRLPDDGLKIDIWWSDILVFVMVMERLHWESDDRSGMVREILEGTINF
jgi:hypothetical protein